MDNLLLTPNIARELLANYEQFTKFGKSEVDGLNLEQFQKLLAAYGALYFKTKDVSVVLKELQELAASGQQMLPQAAIPNADRLKELAEEHERLIQEKTAGRADEWIRQQQAVVERKLENVETADSVLYEAVSDSGTETARKPGPSSVATLTPEEPPAPQDEVGDFVKNKRIEDLERTLAEADIPQEFQRETAEQLDQVLGLVQSEGVRLTPEALRERVFSIVSRTTNQPPTPEVVEIITKRLSIQRPVGAPASLFESTPRSLKPYIREPREERPQTQAVRRDSAQQFASLALRGEPYWRHLGRQLLPTSWFGRGIKNNYLLNLQKIKAQIERFRAEQPTEYARSIQTLLAAEQRVDELIAQNSPESFPELERRLDSVEVVLPETPEATGGLETQQFPSQQIVRGFLKESQAARQNFFSNFAIRFKNFLINTGNGIGRFFSFTLPRALGFGGRIGSGLVASTVPSSGGSLAIPASRMLGSLANLGGMGLRGGATIASRSLMGLATLGGAEALPLIAILAVALGSVFVLAIFVITIQHGVFLKETTSVGIIPESKYIDLTKTAEPTSLANSALPTEVKYTIVVGAKEKNLKNVRLTEQFSAYGRNSLPTPVPGAHSISQNLSFGNTPETFVFTIRLGPEYADSVVTNTITVTADVEGGASGEKISRSANVIIGNPPTACFALQGFSESEKVRLSAQIAKISRYSVYVSRLCAGGTVPVIRDARTPGYSGEVFYPEIHLYMDNTRCDPQGNCYKPLNSDANLYYTLAHESGHIYAHRNNTTYNQFAIDRGDEASIPTYTLSNPSPLEEDFPETIAIYIIRKEVPDFGTYDGGSVHIADMSRLWPRHYQFAHNNIFGQQE